MVQFASQHRRVTRIYPDEIGRNSICGRCTEGFYLALFLYNQTHRYGLYTTGRKTRRHFLPKDRRELKTDNAVQYPSCLLCVHEVIVDIPRVLNRL